MQPIQPHPPTYNRTRYGRAAAAKFPERRGARAVLLETRRVAGHERLRPPRGQHVNGKLSPLLPLPPPSPFIHLPYMQLHLYLYWRLLYLSLLSRAASLPSRIIPSLPSGYVPTAFCVHHTTRVQNTHPKITSPHNANLQLPKIE
jgi:hypothetical protein